MSHYLIGQPAEQPAEPPKEPNPEFKKPRSFPPDLHSQFESLLDEVWQREREAELVRRILNACRIEDERQRALARRAQRSDVPRAPNAPKP